MCDSFIFTMITKTRLWRHIYHDIGIPRPKNHDIEIRGLKHHGIEKWRQISHRQVRHRDSKAFFQRTKSHDIEIPRLKNHDIKIPRP